MPLSIHRVLKQQMCYEYRKCRVEKFDKDCINLVTYGGSNTEPMGVKNSHM